MKTASKGSKASTASSQKGKKATADKKPASAAKKQGAQQEQAGSEELKELFHETLKDIYNAEKQLVKALPKMAKAATSQQLIDAFEEHLTVTENQVTRLEQVFEACDLKVSSKKCEAMEGLVQEGQEAIEETEDGSAVRDVALIIAAQKVEHYEIAAYGSLRTIATLLGFDEAAELLQETLDEEGEADKTLTDVAGQINMEAYNEGDEDEDEDEDDLDTEDDEDEEEDEDQGTTSRKGGRGRSL